MSIVHGHKGQYHHNQGRTKKFARESKKDAPKMEEFYPAPRNLSLNFLIWHKKVIPFRTNNQGYLIREAFF